MHALLMRSSESRSCLVVEKVGSQKIMLFQGRCVVCVCASVFACVCWCVCVFVCVSVCPCVCLFVLLSVPVVTLVFLALLNS